MEPVLYLTNRRIDLWLAFLDDIRDEHLLRNYRGILTPEELTRGARFRFAKDQHRYLVTRALARCTLSRYARVRAEEWRFAADTHGRPGILGGDEDTLSLSFNISHTDSLVAIVVTRQQAVGVDIEDLNRKHIELSTADAYFSAAEVSELYAAPEWVRPTRFLEYWTLKESYIKARGLGLAIPLDQFSLSLARSGKIRMATEPALADRAERWALWQFRPSADHVGALCAELPIGNKQTVLVRRVVPMYAEEIVDCEISRTSA